MPHDDPDYSAVCFDLGCHVRLFGRAVGKREGVGLKTLLGLLGTAEQVDR